MSEIETCGALGMRERQMQRSVGDLGQYRLLLRLAAAFRDQRGADHYACEIRLVDQPAPERFHHDAGLDRAGAEPAIVFADRQRQPAEIGELFPGLAAEA